MGVQIIFSLLLLLLYISFSDSTLLEAWGFRRKPPGEAFIPTPIFAPPPIIGATSIFSGPPVYHIRLFPSQPNAILSEKPVIENHEPVETERESILKSNAWIPSDLSYQVVQHINVPTTHVQTSLAGNGFKSFDKSLNPEVSKPLGNGPDVFEAAKGGTDESPKNYKRQRRQRRSSQQLQEDEAKEVLEKLDSESLLEAISALEQRYLSSASPSEVTFINEAFKRLRSSVHEIQTKGTHDSPAPQLDLSNIKGKAALELLAEEVDDYTDYYQDPGSTGVENSSVFMELLSLAAKNRKNDS